MASDYYGPDDFGASPFDDLLARIFGRAGPRRSVQRVDITRLMAGPARELVGAAAGEAAERGSGNLDTEDLLWAAAKLDPCRQLLTRAGADPDALIHEAEKHLSRADHRGEPLQLTPGAKRALLDAHQISRTLGSTYIGPEHILFALAVNPESGAGRILSGARVTPEALSRALADQGFQPGGAPPRHRSATPALDEFGRDLTAAARAGRIDPVIGRDDEIDQTVEVLSRRTKNNPVLIGEAGVGKTAIVEGLANRIADDDVPQTLAGKRVVQLEPPNVVAGTRYRGDFEERVKRIVDEIREHGSELIIFIDELHTIVAAGAGSEGGMDAGNMLKSALARGELHVIGATTLDEYRKSIEKDAALARRFQPILVPEPTLDDAIAILRGLRDRYEAHHQVRYTDGALIAAVELGDRYLTDRFLPDKAVDLIDQAGARVRLRTKTPGTDLRELARRAGELQRDKDQAVSCEQYERASQLRDQISEVEQQIEQCGGDQCSVPEVTVDDIAQVVSRITRIPVQQLTEEEKVRLLRLEQHLHERVIGQDEAVSAVAEAVRRSRAGLGDPQRPVGSFLFLGPTGVGKTELARALTEALFGADSRMIRLDMSEFQERHTVSRLVGAPPGYVGYEEAGQLTETVRRRPYSVILLDEIEKAHPDVFNVLLQVLDDGRLTDGQGRTVDFKNTVLIMTSNLGSDLITHRAGPLGFAGPAASSAAGQQDGLQHQLMRRLHESFRPEFLNRIDEIIIFRQLDQAELRRITELLLDDTRRRLGAHDITVEFTQAAVDWIAEHGYQPEFGARPMRRTIQREVDNQLSRLLLDGRITAGQRVSTDVADGALTFTVGDRHGGLAGRRLARDPLPATSASLVPQGPEPTVRRDSVGHRDAGPVGDHRGRGRVPAEHRRRGAAARGQQQVGGCRAGQRRDPAHRRREAAAGSPGQGGHAAGRAPVAGVQSPGARPHRPSLLVHVRVRALPRVRLDLVRHPRGHPRTRAWLAGPQQAGGQAPCERSLALSAAADRAARGGRGCRDLPHGPDRAVSKPRLTASHGDRRAAKVSRTRRAGA
jgi:ATP-dependent Clp protease ATP-binding subunit ClpC